jgi:uncharacterized protein
MPTTMNSAQDHAHSLDAAHRLALRAIVRNAADTVAPVWPLKTFIACNPLQGFEGLPFEQAVAEGNTLFGGRGYLPNGEYRRQWRDGRIAETALRDAFRRRMAPPVRQLAIGGETIDAGNLLWRHLTVGLGADDLPEPGPADPHLSAAARIAAETVEDTAGDGIQDGRGGSGGGHASWRTERETLAGWIDRVRGSDLRAEIDRQSAKWCAAFLDEGQATLAMPGREKGLYAAWKALAGHDGDLVRAGVRNPALHVNALPGQPDDALLALLRRFEIPTAQWQRYLSLHLAALPGWAGFIKWRADQPDYAWQTRHPADPLDFLAVRVALESMLIDAAQLPSAGWPTVGSIAAQLSTVAPAAPPWFDRRDRLTRRLLRIAEAANLPAAALSTASADEIRAVLDLLDGFPDDTHGAFWLEAAEETYRAPLTAALASAAGSAAPAAEDEPGERPDAQLVFCIDVRSEPFRRALEQQGRYETYGFAGFFGVPMRFTPFLGGEDCDLCPVLLQPKHHLTERPAPTDARRAERRRAAVGALRVLKNTWSAVKGDVAAPFAMVEAVGGLSVATLAGKTVAPTGFARMIDAIERRIAPPPALAPVVDLECRAEDGGGGWWGMTTEEQTFYAAAAIRIMGLAAPFARLVALCGHGGATVNNPYAAALDCGACGGNHGGPNARVMAAIFNKPAVRAALARQGIEIPEDTLFVAAEHNTTTDRVTLFPGIGLDGAGAPPDSHQADLARLTRDLEAAARANSGWRARHLPGGGGGGRRRDALSHVLARSLDWAQVRPEWGLARNAAFIVGPRGWTAAVDLEGRAFLHSYDWRGDGDGKALEIILTAPMVVAEWINTQYYFSTVDNDRYGSGNKTTQNVTGLTGVMQGNASDLKTGLPWQSVMGDDGRPYHEPLRLMTAVLAPVDRVTAIVARNAILQKLFGNGWVALQAIDPESGRSFRYERSGTWRETNRGSEPHGGDGAVGASPTSEPAAAALDGRELEPSISI